MELKAKEIEQYIASGAPTLGTLFYGADEGLAQTYCNKLAKNILGEEADPMLNIHITKDLLSEQPEIIESEINTPAMFGGKKVIRITSIDRNFYNPIIDALDNLTEEQAVSLAQEVCIIVTAGDITKTSPLVKLFNSKSFLRFGICYKEDEKALANALADYASKNNINTSRDVINYISQNAQGNRQIAINELEKILLFTNNSSNITYDDIIQITKNTSETTFNDISHAVFDGNFKLVEKHIDKCTQQGLAEIGIIRALRNYTARMITYADELKQGAKMSDINRKLFWKERDKISAHIRKTSGEFGEKKLWRIHEILFKAENDAKSTGANLPLILSRSVTAITRMLAS